MTQPTAIEAALARTASDLRGAERAAFLSQACGGDPDLRRRVESLLATQEQATRPEAVAPAVESTDLSEAPGCVIGRYRLLEKLGEGGFGAVWAAEQREPVKRRVALKILKLGMDTRAVVARFEAERQALAMMDHPNIAKILDAGVTGAPPAPARSESGGEHAPGGTARGERVGAGRPYFVMELVRGVRITEYCDQQHLPTKDRIGLFIKVCQAIQHAHQKGIIHRDIKPSNILVALHDGVPVPKVIDFGIAKATQRELTDSTVYTQCQQFIGTPAYMSPEQAEMSGLDIDTRSDIYSLGVLLYELLAGRTPFDAKELAAAGIDAMRRTIREKEPPRPSARVSTLQAEEQTTTARCRSTDRARLVHQLRGDLDWIVMRCLEKDRTRRYETANGVAADLVRHLNQEPVLARPPSATYRLQKLICRNKVLSVATVLVLGAVLVGSWISLGQARRARRELGRALAAEARAQAEKTNAQAALHFIQDDVLSQASPGFQPDRDLKVRTLVDRVSDRLEQDSGRPPLVEASIRQTLGSVYTELGDYAKAARHYEGALRLQRQYLGERHLDSLRSLYGLAMARWWRGELLQAEPLTRQGLEASREALGAKDPLTLQFMQVRAFALMFLGIQPWTEVEPFYRETLALHREVLGNDSRETPKLIYGLGVGYSLNWQDAKAAPLIEEGLEQSRRVLGEKHPQTAALMAILAYVYSHLQQFERAEPLARTSLEISQSVLGEENIRTVGRMLVLARVYMMEQDAERAEPLVERALRLSRDLPLENDPFSALHLSNLGWEYIQQGRLEQADILCGRAVQMFRGKPDINPLASPRVIIPLGAIRLAQGNFGEAEELLREGLAQSERHWPDAAYRYYAVSLLGECLAGRERYAEAEPLLLEGLQGLQARQAMMPPYVNPSRRVQEAMERLVRLYESWGKPSQAAEWRTRLAALEQTLSPNPAPTRPP